MAKYWKYNLVTLLPSRLYNLLQLFFFFEENKLNVANADTEQSHLQRSRRPKVHFSCTKVTNILNSKMISPTGRSEKLAPESGRRGRADHLVRIWGRKFCQSSRKSCDIEGGDSGNNRRLNISWLLGDLVLRAAFKLVCIKLLRVR